MRDRRHPRRHRPKRDRPKRDRPNRDRPNRDRPNRRRLGRDFGWLWAANAVSAYGSGLALGALPLIAVLVLHASPARVSVLSAVGPAVGALVAVPLAPWIEARRKRPVLVALDLTRFAATATIPVAYGLGRLTFAHLLAVSALLAAARIGFGAAAGACLKALVRPDDLLTANARFEATNWGSLAVGPPLGGAAIGWFGAVATVVADAVSYLLSALGLLMIRDRAPAPIRPAEQASGRTAGQAAGRPAEQAAEQASGRPAEPSGVSPGAPVRPRRTDLAAGWRHILTHPVLRALYLNNMLVSGLIMATEPLLAVLLLGRLGFAPWQYGVAFAAPCVGGFVGSRLAPRVAARLGSDRVFRTVGTLRAVCLPGLAFVRPGPLGLLTVIAVELAVIIGMSVYTPVLVTYRLRHTPDHLVARTLTAWSIGQQAAIATLTALGGLLAEFTGPRSALAVAGVLILVSPLLLPRSPAAASRRPGSESEPGLPRACASGTSQHTSVP